MCTIQKVYGLLAQSVAALLLSACQSGAVETIRVDTSVEHQEIVGWEVVSRLWEFDKDSNRFNGSWLKHRYAILETLIAEGGITRLRLEIRSGAENPVDYWSDFTAGKLTYEGFKDHFYEKINDDDDPHHASPDGFQFSELDYRVENIVLPAMAVAERHGIELALNLNYVDFRWTERQGTLSHAQNPEEYAELIAATFARLKEKYGLVPDQFEVILEPDNTDGWRGPQIGRAMLATVERFRADDVELPPMIAPSTAHASAALNYLDGIASVPGALPLVQTISYHRYDPLLNEDTIREIGERGRSLGKRTAMLEHVEGTADELLEDLIDGNASAWLLWGIAWNGERDGYPVIVDERAEGPARVRLSTVGKQLALVFNNGRPGDVRIGVSASHPQLRSAAFRKADGTHALLVSASLGAGHGRSARVMERLWPDVHYRVIITGLDVGLHLVRSVNQEGQETSCISRLYTPLSIKTGTVMAVTSVPRGLQAPPCKAA